MLIAPVAKHRSPAMCRAVARFPRKQFFVRAVGVADSTDWARLNENDNIALLIVVQPDGVGGEFGAGYHSPPPDFAVQNGDSLGCAIGNRLRFKLVAQDQVRSRPHSFLKFLDESEMRFATRCDRKIRSCISGKSGRTHDRNGKRFSLFQHRLVARIRKELSRDHPANTETAARVGIKPVAVHCKEFFGHHAAPWRTVRPSAHFKSEGT